MSYKVVGPQGRTCATADTWVQAVEEATELSLRLRFRFRVGAVEARLPFERERRRVLLAADAYVDSYWKDPSAPVIRVMRCHYMHELARLARLVDVSVEPHQEYFVEQSLARSGYPALPVR